MAEVSLIAILLFRIILRGFFPLSIWLFSTPVYSNNKDLYVNSTGSNTVQAKADFTPLITASRSAGCSCQWI